MVRIGQKLFLKNYISSNRRLPMNDNVSKGCIMVVNRCQLATRKCFRNLGSYFCSIVLLARIYGWSLYLRGLGNLFDLSNNLLFKVFNRATKEPCSPQLRSLCLVSIIMAIIYRKSRELGIIKFFFLWQEVTVGSSSKAWIFAFWDIPKSLSMIVWITVRKISLCFTNWVFKEDHCGVLWS